MNIRERKLAGEMPSIVAFELLNKGLQRHEVAKSLFAAFRESEAIIGPSRKLCSGIYNKVQASVETPDFLILSELRNSGLPVRVPTEPPPAKNP